MFLLNSTQSHYLAAVRRYCVFHNQLLFVCRTRVKFNPTDIFISANTSEPFGLLVIMFIYFSPDVVVAVSHVMCVES